GMAIGLVTAEDYDSKGGQYKLLTDIQGLEDFGGDMDFKVTGTKDGITAIQLDIKLKGIDYEIIEGALKRAKAARLKVLELIAKIISAPRKEMSVYAPRIYSHKIDKEKIGEIIGPAGKNIRAIIEECGGKEITSIDIDDDGMIFIASTDAKMGEKALQIIKDSTKEVQVGEIYQGEVINIQKDRMSGKEIGAIVQITPKLDGMVHISQIADYRVNKVSDVLHIGDKG
ncbi:MAG: S1 RNA-binding domain-containing protein, partial [Patescibacteria group bacterium]|nr:S1 RNA-binding domain-containing protein [Patescibacteria group bacterium]